MKFIRMLFSVLLMLVVGGCSLFSGDEGSTDVTSAATFTPEPTANIVQVPAADETGGDTATSAEAALPTPVSLPTPAPTAVPTPDRSQPTSYVVQTGDVLGLIAERFDVDIAELRRVNDLSGNLIRVGQTLVIPALEPAVTAPQSGDETASTSTGSDTTESTTSAPAEPVDCGGNVVGHCVQPGDSLLGIASQYGVSVDDLRAANASIVGDTIRIGDVLNIPGQTAPDPGPSDSTTPGDGTDPAPDTQAPPQSDEDCRARNIEYPYFHAADGLCYANPIGGSDDTQETPGTGAGSTADGSRFVTLTIPAGQQCPDNAPFYGQFELNGTVTDGPACYPAIAVIEATPTPAPTPTPGGTI